VGTFFLVLVGAGGAVLEAQTGMIGRSAGVVAPGLLVMAMILAIGAVSGAHLNPVVSVAFALRRDFQWRRLPGYVTAQLAGALLACLLLRATFGTAGELGATLPRPGFTDLQGFVIETVLTFGLVTTILGTASTAQNVGPLAAFGVGGYIVLAGLWSSPVSGASMNPARSLGPDLVRGKLFRPLALPRRAAPRGPPRGRCCLRAPGPRRRPGRAESGRRDVGASVCQEPGPAACVTACGAGVTAYEDLPQSGRSRLDAEPPLWVRRGRAGHRPA